MRRQAVRQVVGPGCERQSEKSLSGRLPHSSPSVDLRGEEDTAACELGFSSPGSPTSVRGGSETICFYKEQHVILGEDPTTTPHNIEDTSEKPKPQPAGMNSEDEEEEDDGRHMTMGPAMLHARTCLRLHIVQSVLAVENRQMHLDVNRLAMNSQLNYSYHV
ncbi:hypothetical protein UY3_02490 [Chelonia mydas]|uniref:Uncharacterized protein n=1 Tax=Chelonia mydas TaxID=8469 RepID=M7CHF6_CHEMY|nr:hypothetical protein UY3_02490 [Chelonia mydas]